MVEPIQITSTGTEAQPTILETELDSICLVLGQMKARLQRLQLLDHLTPSEKAELEAALTRTEDRIVELRQVVRGEA